VFLAKVIGNVVSTMKDPGLESRKLLIIQPIGLGGQPDGEPLVALDGAGVGVGEDVFYVGGKEAAFLFLPAHVPADIGIVGKVDAREER
jgi:ethanolamine utilization protein EutN